MCVVQSLHEHSLARQQPNIRMMIPKRITMAAAVLFVTELFERSNMALLLQKIDHASGSDAVDKTLNHGSLLLTVSDDMKMIRHDHVSKNEGAARCSRFIERGHRRLISMCRDERRTDDLLLQRSG